MAEQEVQKPVCTSVFKSGGNTISRQTFTKQWIALVNQLEKDRGISAQKDATGRLT